MFEHYLTFVLRLNTKQVIFKSLQSLNQELHNAQLLFLTATKIYKTNVICYYGLSYAYRILCLFQWLTNLNEQKLSDWS